ncbi:MAG: hypothetical protein ACREPE_09465 [Lysobacter sp.]
MCIVKFAASVVLGMAMVASAASASQPTTPLQTETIRSQQAKIKAEVEARAGAFKDVPASTRGQLLSQQALVLGLIEGKKTTDELDAAKQSELFAALESIDAMVTKANDERRVCELRKTLGSNQKERICRTAKQVREEREAARAQLDRMQSGRGG